MKTHDNLCHNIPVHDGRAFSWSKNEGTVELSELRCRVVSSRVWLDSCDEGFFVVSPRTGNRILFTLLEVGDNDGDITHWRYISYEQPRSERDPIIVTVFND